MGRQIQIRLSESAEDALFEHLKSKFPHCKLINDTYPRDWDRSSVWQSPDSPTWLIIDDRTEQILIDSSFRITGGPDEGVWRIVSKAFSCIEWCRDFGYGDPGGRLYLDTDGDPIWLDISAETGHDIEKMFNLARRWIKKHCTPEGQGRFPIWRD